MATKSQLERVKEDARRIQLRRQRDEAEDRAAAEAALGEKVEVKETKKTSKK